MVAAEISRMEREITSCSRQYSVALVRTHQERDAVFAIRIAVFVEEQAVPIEEELDAYDVVATHFCVRLTDGDPTEQADIVATARMVDKGEGIGKIGRVAVLKPWRGAGIGSLLMSHIERHAIENGFVSVILEAQCNAMPFYEKLGYTAEGDVYLDANIEHRWMSKRIGALQ